MEMLQTIRRKEYNNAIYANTLLQLAEIKSPKKNIAIYERDITPLKFIIDSVLNNLKENFNAAGTIEEIQTKLNEHFFHYDRSVEPLINDVLLLLKTFSEITNAKSLKLMLACINTNMCKKFHTDINDLRLLCTYSGPGTLWAPDEAINRAHLDDKRVKDIISDNSAIQQLKTGDWALLKGAIYHPKNTKACVHRSPTIEETGERRLLLRIDTNEFLNFEL